MPETIKWTVSTQIPSGPRVSEAGALVVEAYDKLNIVLEPGSSDIDVEVQPASSDGQVTFLALVASAYSSDLSYSPDAGTTTFAFEGPVALIGAGAVSLLAPAPEQLRFANATADPVTVEILVGRDATP